jgi:4-hydroxy-2-oxoglutarate aldolase
MGEVLGNVKPEFRVLAGGAGFLLPALAIGACGGILASANIAPAHCLGIFSAFAAGNIDRARERSIPLYLSMQPLLPGGGVPALKAVMDRLGLYGGHLRRPLLPAGEAVVNQLTELMDENELLLYK